mmetsp:Transcript_6567/g.15186  ORF Transcript_6567/g.15186 Transcript_6567/m.15186 type:complete len:202 (-) Transcript_6567:611-1216(-)
MNDLVHSSQVKRVEDSLWKAAGHDRGRWSAEVQPGHRSRMDSASSRSMSSSSATGVPDGSGVSRALKSAASSVSSDSISSSLSRASSSGSTAGIWDFRGCSVATSLADRARAESSNSSRESTPCIPRLSSNSSELSSSTLLGEPPLVANSSELSTSTGGGNGILGNGSSGGGRTKQLGGASRSTRSAGASGISVIGGRETP